VDECFLQVKFFARHGRMAGSAAAVRRKLVGFITGTFFLSLFHKLIQTSIEIKVLHLQYIDTIFAFFLNFCFRKINSVLKIKTL